MFQTKLILLALFSLSVSQPQPRRDVKDYTWEIFKNENNKTFKNSTEDSFRKRVWQTAIDLITNHNQRAGQNKHSYFLGVNLFTDLLPEEFKKNWLGLKLSKISKTSVQTKKHGLKINQKLSASKDWRKLGKVTFIKNQWSCGSCWAFSSIATIESQYLIKKNQPWFLSEQNLIDCSSDYGNHGCSGGWPDNAYNFIIANKGVSTSLFFYPYVAKNQTCKTNVFKVASISSYYSSGYPNSNIEDQMVQAIDQVGPISVVLNADLLQYYSSGIINEPNCSTKVNHAVVAVGYGTENGVDYFIIRNSWGLFWGEFGYFRIVRNKNMCGIGTYFSYPIL